MIRDTSAIYGAHPDSEQQGDTAINIRGIQPGGSLPPSTSPNAKARVVKVDNLLYRFVSSTVEIAATSQQKIVGNSSKRRYLMIQNKGANTVEMGFSSKGKDIEIPSGGVLSFETGIVTSTEVYGYSLNGTTLAVIEGIII